jgi:hypothetical protein
MTTQVLADGLVDPSAVVVDGASVYVAEEGRIVRVPRRGGAGETVAELERPLRLAFAGGVLFTTDCCEEGALFRIDGGAVAIAARLSYPAGLAVGSGGVFVSCMGDDRDNGSVVWVPAQGGARLIASGLVAPTGLALEGDAVLVLDRLGRVITVPADGGQLSVRAQPDEAVRERISDGEAVELSPSTSLVLDSSAPPFHGLVAADDVVAWIGADGRLRRFGAQLPDEPERALHATHSMSSDLCVVGGFLYYTDAMRGAVARVPARVDAPATVCAPAADVRAIAVADGILYCVAAAGTLTATAI